MYLLPISPICVLICISKKVVAIAHKLARIVYHLLKYQVPFSALLPEQKDARYRERALRNLQRKALKLGARLVVAHG